MTNPYAIGLAKNEANYQPLTPLSFLERSAKVYPAHTAIIHGEQRFTYAEFYARSRKLASALASRGIGKGDTVSVMLANTPPMLECHYGVPMTGAVLNTLNTRLDAAILAFTLDHAETKVLIVDREFSALMKEALAMAKEAKPIVIDYDDPEFAQDGPLIGEHRIRSLHRRRRSGLRLADARRRMGRHLAQLHLGAPPATRRASSTTIAARPAGPGQRDDRGHAKAPGLSVDAADVPLQRLVLPVDAVGHRRHPCVPAPGARQADVGRIADHKVTHLCGAPIVMSTMPQRADEEKRELRPDRPVLHRRRPAAGSVLAGMADAGFNVTHLYGLTETYGPAVVNDWNADWDNLPGPSARPRRRARACPMWRWKTSP
jgi:fatty-acyl-CoA synthase